MFNSRTTLLRFAIALVPAALPAMAAAESTATPESGAQQAPVADQSAPAPGAPLETPSESRFRWGINAAGGPMMGAYSGGAGGIDARFGMQLSNMLGVYAQPVLLVGAGVSADAKSMSASATGLALYGLGAVADATFGDLFYIAGGPELLLGGVGSASATSGGTSSASASTGPFFSLTGRTGFAFGSMRPDRRRAFTLGLDMHVVFAGGAAVLPMLALGYESF